MPSIPSFSEQWHEGREDARATQDRSIGSDLLASSLTGPKARERMSCATPTRPSITLGLASYLRVWARVPVSGRATRRDRRRPALVLFGPVFSGVLSSRCPSRYGGLLTDDPAASAALISEANRARASFVPRTSSEAPASAFQHAPHRDHSRSSPCIAGNSGRALKDTDRRFETR
jgi:hypothetical protein